MKYNSVFLKIFITFISLGFALWFIGCENQVVEPINERQMLEKKGGTPADGNGNKLVVELDEQWVTDCGLNATMVGWFQLKVFGPENNPNIDITIFHLLFTYTDAEGNVFTWRDVGPDHWYVKDGMLYVSMTGRSTGSGVIGHVVFNVTNWEFVHVAGKVFGDIDAYACEQLN